MKTLDASNDVITVPIRGGITEGGLIIIGIVLVVLALLIIVIIGLWKYGNDIRTAVRAARLEAAEANKQVTNHHSKNLRIDLDDKDTETHKKLDKVIETVESVNSRFDRMNDRITGLDRRMTGMDTRINNIKENRK